MYENELYHHGIKGMKWGVRRFQTKDGGLTSAGRKRYNDGEISIGQFFKNKKLRERATQNQYRTDKKVAKAAYKVAKKQDKTQAKEAYKTAKKQAKRDRDRNLINDQYQAYKDTKKVSYKSIASLSAKTAVAGLVTSEVGRVMARNGHRHAGAFLEGFGQGMVGGAAVAGLANAGTVYMARKLKV